MQPALRMANAPLLSTLALGFALALLATAITPRPSLAEKALPDPEPNCGAGTSLLCRQWSTCDGGWEADGRTCHSTITNVYWYYRR
jgi:hypothetical protein